MQKYKITSWTLLHQLATHTAALLSLRGPSGTHCTPGTLGPGLYWVADAHTDSCRHNGRVAALIIYTFWSAWRKRYLHAELGGGNADKSTQQQRQCEVRRQPHKEPDDLI